MREAIRGIDSRYEYGAQLMARDTRPIGIRAAEFLSNPIASAIIYASSITLIWIFPAILDLVVASIVFMFTFAVSRKHVLPFRMPLTSGHVDNNDLIPGTFKAKKAEGIAFFGNDRINQEELWFTNTDLRTHVLIFGSTGSGKTEALISLAYNALLYGSGFIYVDGKGDNSLFAKIFSMVRSMGRDDDLLAINFMTGARDVVGPQRNRLSNTINPFSNGSSSMLSQLVISLMDQSSSDPNGDMWKGRAINFVESLMKILTVMRDDGHILLDANTIRDYFILDKLESIVIDKKFPTPDGHKVALDSYPSQVTDPLRNYILNLPGYNPSKKGKQGGEVLEQHGFITMQLTRVFGSLADTYGHIIRTNLAEVDVKDVVLNRRILVVLLPALEKSPEELSNLGKIIIASLKAMMASGLGDAIEGDFRDVVARKPTNSPSPYICIMDEYGYYAVKGFAIVAAQARSLGFSAIFAGQDLPAFQTASKEEAASIGANCNIKICMKLEDPQETWEYFNKAAGETYVTNVSGFQMNPGSFTMNYMDTKNASVDRRQRIELLDLKDQREGEAHIFFKSRIVRAQMFYANPKDVPQLRVNKFLKVDSPPEKDLIEMRERLQRFESVFKRYNTNLPNIRINEDIALLANAFKESYGLRPHERGISGLISILEHEVAAHRELAKAFAPELPKDSMSLFSQVPTSPTIEKMVGKDNINLFQEPLVRNDKTHKDLIHIERLAGSDESSATSTAKRLITEVEKLTEFPGNMQAPNNTKEQFLADLNRLIVKLGGKPFTPPPPKIPSLPDLPDLPTFSEPPDFSKLQGQIKNMNLDLSNPKKLPDIDDSDLDDLEKLLDDD